MKRILLLFIVFTLALAACAPPTPGAPTPTLTSTPRASATLSKPTTLFSGPGNVSYETVAELPAGTELYLSGLFGSFVRASVDQGGKKTTGFILRDSVQGMPGGLPTLDRLQVPWEPMYLPECAPGQYDSQTNTVTFANQYGEGYFATESAVWSLEKPVRIQIGQLAATGDNSAGIKVLGTPEGSVEQGNWWKGVTAMSIESHGGEYQLTLRDGVSENSTASIALDRSASLPVQILFDQPEGKSFAVLDENNRELMHIDVAAVGGVNLPDGLFPNREFYFGTVTMGNNASLAITGLSVGTEPDGKRAEPVATGPGLASLADQKGLTIGTDFDTTRMIDRRYCQTMLRDFNLVSIDEFSVDGAPYWLGPGQYDFSSIDRSVDFASQRGWKVYASHLVWGEYSCLPDWLRNGTFTRDEYVSLLEQHIKTVAGRYVDRIQFWSIANEAIERQYWTNVTHTPYSDFWYDKIGPEYIEMAFRWAREADPDGILVFNGGASSPPFDEYTRSVTDSILATVRDLKAKGVPIDAVGMQLHLLEPGGLQSPPQRSELVATMREFAALGVKIYITEHEVDIGSQLGTQEERYAFQAQVYRDVMEACLESGACDVYITWGFADSLSWVICSFPFPRCLNEPNGDPLLFDRDINPKPAYDAVMNALAGVAATPTPAGVVTPTPQGTPTAPTPNPEAVLTLYDDFDDTAYDSLFDPAKWRLSGSSPDPQVHQQDGILVFTDASQDAGVDVKLVARAYDGIHLEESTFIEANLAVPAVSAPGSVGTNILASDPAMGTWFAGCNIEHYSSQFRGSCSDFVWPQKEGHSFDTPKQYFEPGSWHTFRIELDPVTMTITYIIDGVQAGSHVLADAETLRNAGFQFSLSSWKTQSTPPDTTLTGSISYVSIGNISR